MADLVISVYHSPERYYAEIQNRVNTLEAIAKKGGFKAYFATLTFPSEFHKFKTTKSGKQIKNPIYNGINPKESVKVLTKMYAKLRQDTGCRMRRRPTPLGMVLEAGDQWHCEGVRPVVEPTARSLPQGLAFWRALLQDERTLTLYVGCQEWAWQRR